MLTYNLIPENEDPEDDGSQTINDDDGSTDPFEFPDPDED
jgi:hypothetical protein